MIIAAWLVAKRLLSSAWRFLETPVGSWVLRVAICIALVACGEFHGFYRGVQSEKAAEAKRIAQAVKVVSKVEKGAEAITAKTEAKTTERVVEIRTVTKALTKEVPVYVTAEADRVAVLPIGLIRLHNQAALGVSEISSNPGFVSDAPSGVAASTFGRIFVANYGAAHEWKEAALACRSWVSEQAANFNSQIDTARP